MPTVWDRIENLEQSEKTKKEKRFDCKGLIFTICYAGIKVSIDKLQELDIFRKLVNFFTISVPQLTYIKKVPNHIIKSNNIIFPRFGMLKYIEERLVNYKLFNSIKPGNPPDIKFKWKGNFTNNQPLIADTILKNYFNSNSVMSGKSGVIVNLEAGQGKSFLASGLIQHFQQKTLIICHTISILNQWIELLRNGYPANTISQYSGNNKDNGDIVVGIINSLLLDTLFINDLEVSPRDFFKCFGFIVFDEIHLYSSQGRKQIYNKCQSQYMLGLSATPDENKDGLDLVNIWNCGEILDATTIPGYTVEDINFKGEVTVIKYYGHPDYTEIILNETTDIINHSKMVNNICDDPYRLYVVVKSIFDLRKTKKNIFVFADRRSYLEKIGVYMEKFGIISHQILSDDDKSKITSIMGGSTADTMRHAQENCNVILTTYQYAGTGLSINRMDALVLATPRKSKSKQYIGRIFRIGSNYDSVRQIIDIVDYTTHMKSQYYMRKKYYDDKKFPINKQSIKWEDIDVTKIEIV